MRNAVGHPYPNSYRGLFQVGNMKNSVGPSYSGHHSSNNVSGNQS